MNKIFFAILILLFSTHLFAAELASKYIHFSIEMSSESETIPATLFNELGLGIYNGVLEDTGTGELYECESGKRLEFVNYSSNKKAIYFTMELLSGGDPRCGKASDAFNFMINELETNLAKYGFDLL